MELNISKDKCCGCSACMAICPTKIIQMTEDEEGFLYPHVLDERKCLNCGLCKKICPMENGKFQSIQKYYAAINIDDEIWRSSSSGGIFFALGKYIIEEKQGVVFGAKWHLFDVEIDYTETIEGLKIFRKSKYVAVNPGNSFQTVREMLERERYVLFSGTPCMINGLKNYLRKEYERLYTVDFVCHGQGSPVFFKKWVQYLTKKYKNDLIHYEFRIKKEQRDHINSNCVSYTFKHPLVLHGGVSRLVVTRDYYHHAYVKGLCMRKSCEKCVFPVNRAADMTLADFKRQTGVISYNEEQRNISTIITNSLKGLELLQSISNSLKFFEASKDYIDKYNPKIVESLSGNIHRNSFMNDVLSDKPIKQTIFRYARITPSEWVEYNCSNRTYNLLYPLVHLLDLVYFAFRKIVRIVRRE